MRRNLSKLAWCIVVFITLTNLITSLLSTSATTVQAATASGTTVVDDVDENADDDKSFDGINSLIGTTIDGVVGIITWVAKLPFLLLALAATSLMTGMAHLGGSKIEQIEFNDGLEKLGSNVSGVGLKSKIDVSIPESVTEMTFRGAKTLIVKSGSYAESYAKEYADKLGMAYKVE